MCRAERVLVFEFTFGARKKDDDASGQGGWGLKKLKDQKRKSRSKMGASWRARQNAESSK